MSRADYSRPVLFIPGAIPVHALFPVLNMGVTNLET